MTYSGDVFLFPGTYPGLSISIIYYPVARLHIQDSDNGVLLCHYPFRLRTHKHVEAHVAPQIVHCLLTFGIPATTTRLRSKH